MYTNYFNHQQNLDRINAQIGELEKIKQQMQQPVQPITQNFQLAPNNYIRYAKSLNEVNSINVNGDTPFFSNDMCVLWVKNASGGVKTYELKEIVEKDEKDLQIEFLKAQIEDLKKGMSKNAKSNDDNANESAKNEESTDVSDGGDSNK